MTLEKLKHFILLQFDKVDQLVDYSDFMTLHPSYDY